ncbi:tripartite tricarboxylate transporter TctB family protein [Paenisporosarcina antarctica]|uniref:Tripartite tricarboxylate transporter TctB family protein n=1 Tax=Paenisporosarcina antarctica TaxID=417367 RepID=A0A4P7A258_9BACL|nr:tripartite tricarboxylate transporter TctB family protein [Paenisporosarcina antarctica]QBP42714.1 tripartite tricarboxylate transporter TctB family protein [Paenisporosarcina antarctica]
MAKVNYILSGLMILLGIWILLLSSDLSGDAASWPKFFTYLLILLSVGLVYDTKFKPNREIDSAGNEEDEIPKDKKQNRNLIYSMVLSVIYILFMQYVGFLLLTPVFIGLLFWLLKYRSIFKLALLSIGTTVFLTVVFQFLLGVPIPQGILDNLF